MESLREALDVVWQWSFLPLGGAIAVAAVLGSGLWDTRWKKSLWVVTLGLLGAAFFLGIRRHEWGEVLFNGQLL